MTYGSCICDFDEVTREWDIKPDCSYHNAAAADPTNHSIPWNCPNYWDGCNCCETCGGWVGPWEPGGHSCGEDLADE